MFKSRIARGLACLLIAVICITALPARSLAASVYNVRVTKSYTYIYQKASTSSAHLKKVTKDTVLLCGASKAGWAYVKYNGVTGYVRTADIAAVKSGSASSGTTANTGTPAKTVESDGAASGGTTAENANDAAEESTPMRTITALKLYKGMSTSSGYYGTINKGKQVPCLSITGSWACVQVGKYKGYVLKSGLTAVNTASGSASSESATTPTYVSLSNVKGITCYAKRSVDMLISAASGAAAVGSLNGGEKMLVTAVKSGWARVVNSKGLVGYIPSDMVSKTKVYVNGNVVLSDWFTGEVQSVFKVGVTAVVTDVLTRQTFQIRRRGGINHADCEPLTKADTSAILAIYGGSTSWNRRAIWVTVGDVTYAASMNFMNHGQQTIYTNGFDGHFCIHFLNSRTSGTDKVDPDHQAAVMLAFNTTP